MSYEWFKFSHFVAALVFVLFLFFHCDATLTSWDYFVATGVLFSLSWLHRQIRTYFENGVRHKAFVEVTNNGWIKVSVPTTIRWIAGQHFFIRFFGLGVHTLAMHPFSVCSLPTVSTASRNAESELVFLIRPHGGLTKRLLKHASQNNAELSLTLDGPYGGVEMTQIERSDRVLLIAGGSGAGWILPMVAGYLRRLQYSPRKIDDASSLEVVLASRDKKTAEWFQEEVEALFAEHKVDGRTAGVQVSLHYTGGSAVASSSAEDVEKTATVEVQSRSSEDASTTSAKYSHSDHRPNLPAVVEAVTATTTAEQSTSIFVCGPLSMQYDVANSVAKEQIKALKGTRGEVSLHVEHFSWA